MQLGKPGSFACLLVHLVLERILTRCLCLCRFSLEWLSLERDNSLPVSLSMFMSEVLWSHLDLWGYILSLCMISYLSLYAISSPESKLGSCTCNFNLLQVFCSVSHQRPHTIEALISFLHLSASTALCSLGHLQRCALTQALLLSWPWHLLIEWHWKVATRPNIHADAPDSLLLNPADSPLVLFEILSDLPSFSLFSVLMLAMPLSATHYS